MWIYVFLFTFLLINYVDRINMSVASGPVAEYFHLSPAMLGIVFSSFLWTYLACLIPSGLISDRLGTRKTAAWGIGLWSLASVFTGIVSSFNGLILTRLCLGVGESTTNPTSLKVIREWIPEKERGLAITVFNAGTCVGPGLGALFVAWLVTEFGWRVSFYVTGGIGFIWLIFWVLFFHRPEEANWLSVEEREEILAQRGMSVQEQNDKTYVSVGTLLRYRSMWGIALSQGCGVYTQYLFLTWLPSYLQSALNISIMKSGAFTALPYLIAAVVMIFLGRLSDKLLSSGDRSSGRRRYAVIFSLLISAVVLFTPFTRSVPLIMMLITVGLIFSNTALALNQAVLNDLLRIPSNSGRANSILFFGGNSFGLLAPIITGFVIQITGKYELAFVIAGVLLLAGSVISFTMTRDAIGEDLLTMQREQGHTASQ
jgi:ACS family glucarate transporter-like MFS transporter